MKGETIRCIFVCLGSAKYRVSLCLGLFSTLFVDLRLPIIHCCHLRLWDYGLLVFVIVMFLAIFFRKRFGMALVW